MVDYNSTHKVDLDWLDYCILSASLLISLAIGFFYAWKDRANTDNDEFLMGGRNMAVLPVAMSLLASFFHATFILGMPVAVYVQGAHIWWQLTVIIPCIALAGEVFVPIFFRLKITSVNELMNLAVVLYAPSIAVASVTGLSTNVSIVIIGLICTAYTALGGLKAVIWTDVFQYSLMILGLLIVLVKGTIDIGGVFEVYRINYLGARLEFNKVLYYTMPFVQLALIPVMYLGHLIYAVYHKCDPMRSGAINRPDELVTHFVSQAVGGEIKGLPGLFVSSLFSASLSTLSSGYNALATIIWEDFVKNKINLGEINPVYVTKGIAMCSGLIAIGLAFIVAEVNSVFEASLKFSGASVAPLFAVFLMGFFSRSVNSYGAVAGLMSGQFFCIWLTIGSIVNKKTFRDILPVSMESCTNNTASLGLGVPFEMIKGSRPPVYHPQGINKLYHIDAFYMATFGFLVSVVIAYVVSWAARKYFKLNEDVDPLYMSSFANRFHGIEPVQENQENELSEFVPKESTTGTERHPKVPKVVFLHTNDKYD
ncbi:Sodium-coupled monocarboxylate transporter 1 [Halotydeus destructor]|nr:Sodium-coupled monocarboxylate transporter 1 [Halotydeus destructor]